MKINSHQPAILYLVLLLTSFTALSQQSPGEADLIKAEEAMNSGNFEAWFQFANKSCDQGNMFACFMVAKGYEPGMAANIPYPKTKDLPKAFGYYKKSGDLGFEVASYMTAEMYRLGEGVAASNENALTYYKQAYLQGDSRASNAIYQMLQNPAPFITFLEECVGKKYYPAARELATIYISGSLGEVNINKAMKWLRIGEQNNHSGSLYVLGYLYRNGLKESNGNFTLDQSGINIPKALEYYQKAANLGSTEAMNNLAEMNLDGEGMAKNANAAFDWFQKACERDNGYSCYMCSWLLVNKMTTRQGDAAAYSRRSLELGYDPNAKN
jgi:TPR repeat protein